MRRVNYFLTGALLLAAVGCEALPPCPPLMLAPASGLTPRLDYSDLATVLAAAVTSDGLLDRDALAEQSQPLSRQLDLLAVTGPTASAKLFVDSPEASAAEVTLAYWYNARAAWAIRLVEDSPPGKTLSRDQLEQRAFTLDARTMTLAKIDRILMRDSDWRTAVAAPGVLKQRAPLPQAPIEAKGVRDEITDRFARYLDDPRRFTIDVRHRSVPLAAVFWAVRGRAIRQYERTYNARGASLVTSLLPHVTGSPYRRLQDAIGYVEVPAPRDGALALVKNKLQ